MLEKQRRYVHLCPGLILDELAEQEQNEKNDKFYDRALRFFREITLPSNGTTKMAGEPGPIGADTFMEIFTRGILKHKGSKEEEMDLLSCYESKKTFRQAAREIAPGELQDIAKDRDLNETFPGTVNQAGEFGIFRGIIDEEYGGAEFGFLEVCP